MISRLGRFEIQAEIGRGGFGQVFRAFDPVMNRIVAVKTLTATEDASSLNRFKNEAVAAGNLRHENIVTVYEFGQEGNTPYLVMQYLDGEDLQHVIKNNTPISLYQKIRIMDQVADGLHCAHRNGVLHRDVKPANIMVLQDGSVKIMDFGIARLMRDTSTRLTQQGYLIGTVVYMAPELFAGTEVDALCDIWSYGVILHELLAGKNPFQTGNVQSEMYRICNQDVEPLPQDVCPKDLQMVVTKLLSRQREFRYQSLDDARFDLQPILKNLERAEADRLVASAQQLLSQGKFLEARGMAREARRLDPQNGAARYIDDRAGTELTRLKVQPQIDDLLQRSDTLAEQRKFDDALGLLDKACKLDTKCEKALVRQQELRVLKQRLDDAARLLDTSDKEFRTNRLTDAFEHASEAVALDPDNPEAQRLLERIRNEIQARETDRAVEAEVRRARGLMAINDLDGAAEVVKNAEVKYPERAEINDLQIKVSQLIAERQRQRDFSKRMDKAKELVRHAQFADAVTELEELLKSFPNEVEAVNLLAYARQEQQARQRNEEIRKMIESSVELGRGQRFDEAIRILEGGLKRFPDDLPLTRQLRSIYGDKQAFDRERALQDGLKRCEALRQSQKWQEAIEQAAKLRVEYPNNRELASLESSIVQERSQAERAAAMREALEQAEDLLKKGRPDDASMVLEAAILRLGAQPKLTDLLEKVHTAQVQERQRQEIRSELKNAYRFERDGDVTGALNIIAGALQRYPESPELSEAKDRLSRDHVNRKVAEWKEDLKRKEWTKSVDELDKLTRVFPADVVSQLNEELQRRQRDDLREKVAEGRRLLKAGQVREAQDYFSAHLLAHGEDAEVKSLGGDIFAERERRKRDQEEEAQRTAFVAECLRASHACEQKGDLPGALGYLAKGLDRFPRDPELADAQKRISEQLATARRSQLLGSIQQALELSNWSQALQLIEQARKGYPNDPALIPLQAAALDKRRIFLESASAAIRRKLGESKIEDARLLFEQHLSSHQDIGTVKALAAEIADAEAQRDARNKAEEQKRAFLSENLKRAADLEHAGDYPRAIATIEKALKTYPADPELSAALGELQSARDRLENDRALAAAVAGIKRDVDRGNWEDALRRLDEVRATFSGAPELKKLEEQARKLRERELQKLVEKARNSLAFGNLGDAEKILTKNLAPFAGESAVVAVANAIKEERARQDELKFRESLIQAARNHTAVHRFPEAEAVINELAARYPSDPEEARLRSALEAAREQEIKEKLYRTGRAEANQLLKSRNYADAITRLEYLLTQFPDDKQLQQDLKGAQAAETRTQRVRQEQATKPLPATGTDFEIPRPRQSRALLYLIAAVVLAGVVGIWYWMSRPGPVDHQLASGGGGSGSGNEHKGGSEPPGVKPVPIDVQPASLKFAYQQGGSAPSAQTITVTGSKEVVDPPKSAAWLKVTPSVGGGKTEFLVQVLPAQLPRGKDTDSYDLIFPGDKKVHVEVEVVASAQEYDVRPRELNFTYQMGGSPPRGQSVTVFGSVDAAPPQKKLAWLIVTRGRTSDGRTELWVQPLPPENLTAGDYSDDLIFLQQKRVHVKVDVQARIPPPPPPPPGGASQTIEVSPTELRFTHLRGGAPPPPQHIRVTGAADITEPKKSAQWMQLTRDSSGFTVRIQTQNFDQDHYSDDVVFTPQTKVHVDLTIKEEPDRFPPAHGDTTWGGGTLNPGDELRIKGLHVVQGSGRVDRRLPFADIVIDRAKLPPGVRVMEGPTEDNNFTLRLRNDSAGALYQVPIYWELKKK